MDTIPLTVARANLNALVARVSRTHEGIWISKRGFPVVALIGAAEWEIRTETGFWASRTDVDEAVRAADSELRSGESIPERIARERFRVMDNLFDPHVRFPW